MFAAAVFTRTWRNTRSFGVRINRVRGATVGSAGAGVVMRGSALRGSDVGNSRMPQLRRWRSARHAHRTRERGSHGIDVTAHETDSDADEGASGAV